MTGREPTHRPSSIPFGELVGALASGLLRSVFRLAVLLCVAAGAAAGAERGAVLVQDPAGKEVERYEASYALLIGVSDYSAGWPDLESVTREIEHVQRVLRAQGFRVTRVLDPDADALERAFKQFIDDHGYSRDNRLLFFFSGHGHTWDDEGHGYLVPADAPRPQTEAGDPGQEFLRKALFMSDILAWSRQMTAKHALFLFDSCFSGAVFKERSLPGQPPHISRAIARPVRQFITAGSAGETVPARSVFAPAFVDALEYGEGDLNDDGYITGTELGLHLEATVSKHARQSPQFGKHPEYRLARGDFVFVVAGSASTAASPEVSVTQALADRARGQVPPASDPAADGDSLRLTHAQRRAVQTALNELGFDAGPADGVFGPRTREALADYQRSAGLPATGYLSDAQYQLVSAFFERPAAVLRARETWTEPVTGMELIWVPAGCFLMGSEEGDADERPVHEVCLQGFWLARTEITQGQWRRVMGENPAHFGSGDDHPVESVSWDEAQAFIARLNEQGAGGLRLPSEAEWEYACRSGGRDQTYCGGEDLDRLAWHAVNSGSGTHPVGGKQGNGLGLFDMSGNVWDWVADCYSDDYAGAPSDGSVWEAGDCYRRVLRGGSWSVAPRFLRAANRDRLNRNARYRNVGFRLARGP